MRLLLILIVTLLVVTASSRIISHSSQSHELRIDSQTNSPNEHRHARHTRGKLAIIDQPDVASIDADYDVQIKHNCVALDKLNKVIQHIECSKDSLLINFASDRSHNCDSDSPQSICSITDALARWTEGTLLNGGFQWNCKQQVGLQDRDVIIMRRVTSQFEVVGENQLIVKTADVSVMECFDSFELVMNLNHTDKPNHSRRPAIDQKLHHNFRQLQSGPSFVFRRTSPSNGFVDDRGDVRLEWSASQWENPSASITISLNRITGPLTNQLVQSWNASLANNGITLQLPNGLISADPYFFSVNYANAGTCPPLSTQGSCCLNRCRADDRSNGQFYVQGARNATIRIPSDLVEWDCNKCSNLNNSAVNVPPYACQLCSQGYNDLHVRAACTDCWMTYSYSAYRLDVSLIGQRATLVVDVDATVHADFFLDMQLGVQTGSSRPGGELSLGQWTASFLGVNFQLSFDLDFEVIHDTNMSGPVNLTGGFDARVRFGGVVGHRNGRVLDLPQGSIVHQPRDLVIRSSGPVDFMFAVQPHLRFDLFTLFSADIACEIFGRIQSVHSVDPPHPALPSGQWWDDRSYRAINHTGVCTEKHIVRNMLSIGVRNNNILVTFNVNILNIWELNYSFNSTNAGHLAVDLPLLASCDGPIDQLHIVPANVTIFFPANSSLNFADDGVMFALTLDVARSLNIHHSRVQILSISTMRNGTSDIELVAVIIRILPTTVNSPSEPSPVVIIDLLAAQIQDGRSALRTSLTTRSMYVEGSSDASYSSTGTWTNMSTGAEGTITEDPTDMNSASSVCGGTFFMIMLIGLIILLV